MNRLVSFIGVLLAVLVAAWLTALGYHFAGVLLAVLLAGLLNGRHDRR